MLNYLKTKDSNEERPHVAIKQKNLIVSYYQIVFPKTWQMLIVSRKGMKVKYPSLICLARLAQRMMGRPHIIGMQKTKKMKRLQSKTLLFMPDVLMK